MKLVKYDVETVTLSWGGLIITFDDGQTAFYSSALLRELLARAEHIQDEDYSDLPEPFVA